MLGIVLHFKPLSPYSHDAVNLFHSPFLLDVCLVVGSHPSVDSAIDIHLSQEKGVAGDFGFSGL